MSGFLSAGIVGGVDIPDTLIDRINDNNSFDATTKQGISINPNFNLDGIKADLSNNQNDGSNPATTAYLTETDFTVLGSTDISGLTNGDEFVINASLSKGTDYFLVVDADGSNFDYGFSNENLGYPLEGDAFDVVNGVDEGQSPPQDDNARSVDRIRNLDY